MRSLRPGDSLARELVAAIQGGDVARLERLLAEHPGLGRARIGAADPGERTLLHIATDWPGNFPHVAATVAALVAAGADPDAPFAGEPAETALHWAASSDDLAALDALLDAGANVEAPGSVIDGGPPLADAVAFGQWQAARRLVERGARPNLWQAAALGLIDLVRIEAVEASSLDLTNAFWCACHGGQQTTAADLLERGAERDWVGHDGLTPLDAARRSEAAELVEWLRGQGARSADELGG